MHGRGWDVATLLGLAAAWAVMAALVGATGPYPVADDWSYATSVIRLLEGGQVELHPFTPTIAFTHVVFGTVVSALFGFDFTTLRSAMYVVGLAGVVATYFLVRAVAGGRPLAALAAAAIATNPIYFLLAGSFMTDVSFYAMATFALWALVRALQTDSRVALAMATLASIAAVLNRQVGMAFPIAFACATMVDRRSRRPWRALTPVAAAGAALLAWQILVPEAGGPSLVANSKLVEAAEFVSGPRGAVLRRVATNAFDWLSYGALLSLPVVVAAAGAVRLRARSVAAISALLAGIWLLLGARPMPALAPNGNWLLTTGVGPLTLRDTMILRLDSVPQLLPIARAALTAVTLWSAATCLAIGSVVVRAIVAEPRQHAARVQILLGVSGLLLLAPSLVSVFFDRYLLPFVPLVFGVTAGAVALKGVRTSRRGALAAGFVVVLVQAAVSVCGGHDYHAWNRARHDAVEWLHTERQVLPSQIDAGFEWSGWRLFDAGYRPVPEKSWWWVQDDRWVVAFGPIPGYREVRRATFERWLPPWGSGAVLVLERVPEP